MTGYESKKAAALDEDGMYLVHHTKGRTFDKFGNKVTNNEDDDTQVYGDALTIAYQSGYYAGKKAAQPVGQAPCVRHCESTAYEIVIRGLKGDIERSYQAGHNAGVAHHKQATAHHKQATKREWVGLTNEEKGFCAAPTYVETVVRTEAKLKEKNA